MKRFRFSLRTLILLAFTAAGAIGVYLRWDPWALERTLPGHADCVSCASYSADGTRILTLDGSNTVRIWDAQTAAVIKTRKGNAKELLDGHAEFSPDGNSVLIRNGLLIWNTLDGREIKLSPRRDQKTSEVERFSVVHAAFFPDGRRVAGVGHRARHHPRVWDASTGEELPEPKWYFGTHHISFSPDGKRVALGAPWSTCFVEDTETGGGRTPLDFFDDPIVCVRFSPDGKRIGCCGGESPPALFDAQTGKRLFDLEGHAGKVRQMAFSGDGKRIVTAGDDTTVRIWDAKNGRPLSKLAREKYSAFSASFSPDGERLIVGGYDTSAQIWLRHRPEQWWGIAWLPEFWIAVVCGIGAVWSFVRDRRKLRAAHETKSTVSV